jgi:hypothetical protein
MPPKKPEEDGIKIGKVILSYRTFLILCVGSVTPFGQAALAKLGFQMPNSDIEAIKSATEQNKTQIERVDGKVSILIVEMERLRMERNRTASE